MLTIIEFTSWVLFRMISRGSLVFISWKRGGRWVSLVNKRQSRNINIEHSDREQSGCCVVLKIKFMIGVTPLTSDESLPQPQMFDSSPISACAWFQLRSPKSPVQNTIRQHHLIPNTSVT